MINKALFNKKLLQYLFFFILNSVVTFAQNPEMFYGDLDVPSRPYAKDPYVIFFQGKYWMYYSTPDKEKKEWYIGIASSSDLVNWEKKETLKVKKAR
jgi:hypothetical protein